MNRIVYWILLVIFLPVMVAGFTFGLLYCYFATGQAYAVQELMRLMIGTKEEAGE